MVALLEENGCPTKVERGGRVFPASDKSSDVIRTLERILARHHVRICLHTPVEAVWAEDGAVLGVVAGGKRQPFDAVILTAGGASYPRTGSTGDGYRMAQELGHTVTPLHPSLVPMTIQEPVSYTHLDVYKRQRYAAGQPAGSESGSAVQQYGTIWRAGAKRPGEHD